MGENVPGLPPYSPPINLTTNQQSAFTEATNQPYSSTEPTNENAQSHTLSANMSNQELGNSQNSISVHRELSSPSPLSAISTDQQASTDNIDQDEINSRDNESNGRQQMQDLSS